MTRTCVYCGETSPATLASCPSCGRSFAAGQMEQVMTPPHGVTPGDGPPPSDALYTKLAMRAVDLSDTFNALFAQPMPGWQVEMGRPGMSTAGGRQALQHIGLRSSGSAGTLVVGSVDQAAARVEIRSFRRVDAMFRERFRRPLPIRAPDWERFAQRLVQFFRDEGITVSVESGVAGRDDTTDELDAPASGFPMAWIAVGCLVVAIFAAIITWIVLTRPPAPAVTPVLYPAPPAVSLPPLPQWPTPAAPPPPTP